MSALSILKKQFPQIESVKDSNKTIEVEVTSKDSSGGRKKDPQSCALAKACVRNKIADVAIIGLSYSYLIKGNKATRYRTSVIVGREITSFDRHQDFASGAYYKLSKISKSNRLDKRRKLPGKHNKIPVNIHTQHTSNIRVTRKNK